MPGSDVVKRSNRILILVGILLAVVAFVGVIALSNKGGGGGGGSSATPTPTLEATTPVVIAAKDIALGQTITNDMVTVQQVTVSQAAAYGSDIFSSVDQVRNKIAATDIKKGDPLHDGIDFLHVRPGSITAGQSISSTIDPGYVAVAMEIDQTTGVGTLIVPGDHVDVILSVYVDQIALTTTDTNKTTVTLPGGQQVTSKMMFQNNKVLATLLPPEAPAASATPAAGAASPTPAPSPSAKSVTNNDQHMIVIIQVKPDQAEVIRWAQRSEKDPKNYIGLALALRSLKDNEAADVTTIGVTFSELVTRYGVLPPDPRGILPASLAAGIKW
jgi:Flp pilus assembly protein CpaB